MALDINKMIDMVRNDDVPSQIRNLEGNERRVPIMLLLDGSSSTSSGADREIFDGVNNLIEQISDGNLGQLRPEYIDITIIRYANSSAEVLVDWTTGDKIKKLSFMSGSGMTPMGKGITLALGKALEMLKNYQNNGIEAYAGGIFNITDGYPNDMGPNESDPEKKQLWQNCIDSIEGLESASSSGTPYFQTLHFGTKGAKLDTLEQLSPRPHRVFDLTSKPIHRAFELIAASMSNLDNIGFGEAIANLEG